MRRPVLAGNWKMNKTLPEAIELVRELVRITTPIRDRDIVIAPPFPFLLPIAERLYDSHILLSAQNLHWEEKGAFTGEISAAMLKSVKCTHVILGHSERRQYFGETDETVSQKMASALKADLTPILCVGETLSEREADKTFERVDSQLMTDLRGVSGVELNKVIIAYEPVWAIGTGRTATNAQAQEVHSHIRGFLGRIYGQDKASLIRILYGGSVTPANISGLMKEPDIDGALVGGASLTAAAFGEIVRYQKG